MKIPVIEADVRTYILQYLTIINPVICKLSNANLKVLGAIIYKNYELRDHPYELRNKMLFSTAVKKEIRESLIDDTGKVTPEANFNNSLMELRKRNIIIGKNNETRLNKLFNIKPDTHGKLVFEWKIK